MKAAIIGYGKMGHAIEAALAARGHRVALIADGDDSLPAAALAACDVAFEFSTPRSAFANVSQCLESGVAVVCGTTGWDGRLEEARALCLKTRGTLFYASNFSIGANLLFELNRRLATLMERFEQYDVSIEEVHHIHKKDAPSGTAIALAEAIVERLPRKREWVCGPAAHPGQLGVSAVRRGEVPGTHRVCYESPTDSLTLTHTLHDRSALAAGAVLAGEFVLGRKGLYDMNDLLKTAYEQNQNDIG